MTKDDLINEYFDWMYDLVCDSKYVKNLSFRKLLSRLYDLEFTYIIANDGNRAEDGINLRYRFGYLYKYEDYIIASYLDDKPCSVLEMIVALSIKCEENIMDDFDSGDRTAEWFWTIMKNLGFYAMDDKNFDRHYVDSAIDILLNREYEPNGKGGLFTIKNCHRDLRSVEIWYQMCWYLDDILNI